MSQSHINSTPVSSNEMVRNQEKIEMNFEHEDLNLKGKENISRKIEKNPQSGRRIYKRFLNQNTLQKQYGWIKHDFAYDSF